MFLEEMSVLFKEKLLIVVNFLFLLKGRTTLNRCVIIDVSNGIPFRSFSLKVTLSRHRLLRVLSYKGSLDGAA